MKKLFVLLIAAGYSLAGIAAEPTGSWILSKTGKMDMKRISFGISKARIVLENGQVLKLPIKELSSYSVDGRIYNKMPLYTYGKPTGELVFMELIGTRGELNLYRHGTIYFEGMEFLTKVDRFYVYDDDKLHLALTEKTLQGVFAFFNLLVSEN